MIDEYVEYIKTLFPPKAKIVVAMSGGVDSSVTAALLHKAGFDIIGVTMQLYRTQERVRSKGCCAGVDIQDAKRVADLMGFKHYVLDYTNLFKEKVIENFINTYEEGQTPIPCGRCNQYMKFGALLDYTNKIGVDFLATGHYAKRVETKDGPKLYKSANKEKDQSYFLALMQYKQFEKVFFPLNDIDKSIVRKLAELLDLNVAKKPESQDICFVTSNNYSDFLYAIRPEMFVNGKIKTTEGEIIGDHTGIAKYTIGQRKGLGLQGGPWYVTEIEVETNSVIVGRIENLKKTMFSIEEFALITQDKNLLKENLMVQIRARHECCEGTLDLEKQIVVFDTPQQSITPGQICAFYGKDEQLLAGAIIKKVIN